MQHPNHSGVFGVGCWDAGSIMACKQQDGQLTTLHDRVPCPQPDPRVPLILLQPDVTQALPRGSNMRGAYTNTGSVDAGPDRKITAADTAD